MRNSEAVAEWVGGGHVPFAASCTKARAAAAKAGSMRAWVCGQLNDDGELGDLLLLQGLERLDLEGTLLLKVGNKS